MAQEKAGFFMNSIWNETFKLPKFSPLEGNTKTDVLIIGGGMAGLLIAHSLKERGINCLVAEKGRICGGTTSGTTAKLTFQHGLIYHKLLSSIGAEKARLYLSANRKAFGKLVALARDIDCDLEMRDSFVYSLSNRAVLEREMNALSKIGYAARFCERVPLPLNTVGAVCFPEQAQFHPLKFAAGIAENLNIREKTFVRELRGMTAITDRGEISAEMIVCATHFPFINKHGSYFLKLYQNRSYFLALDNAQDVGGLYVDESGKGLSFRNYKDVLILGGSAHRTGKESGCWEGIERFAAQKYPAARVSARWAAQDCMSLDDMPYIGHYSASTPRFLVATGFNKWGMTGSMLAAELIADIVSGKKNEYASLFSPSRSILKPQLIKNAFEAVSGLIAPTKKRCPHLGCALKWNEAEHSWDCSCHGSRFDEKGRVLDNPANGNL